MTGFKTSIAAVALSAASAVCSHAQTLGIKKDAPVPLSRAELRVCMEREDELDARSAALKRAHEEQDAGMVRISKSAAALSESLRKLDNYDQAAVDAHNEQARQHDAAVEISNKRADALNAAAKAFNTDSADLLAQCNTRPYMQPDKDAILKERKKSNPRANEKPADRIEPDGQRGTSI